MIYKILDMNEQSVGNVLMLQHGLYYLTFSAEFQHRLRPKPAFKVGTLAEVTAYCQQVMGKGNGRLVKYETPQTPKVMDAGRKRALEQLAAIIKKLL